MKTHKQPYPQNTSFENLLLAFKAARKSKRARADIAEFVINMINPKPKESATDCTDYHGF